jgi:hypothetical protein
MTYFPEDPDNNDFLGGVIGLLIVLALIVGVVMLCGRFA